MSRQIVLGHRADLSNLGDRATSGRAAKLRRRIARFNLSSHNGIQSPGVGNAIAERFVNEVNLDHYTFLLVAALGRCAPDNGERQ